MSKEGKEKEKEKGWREEKRNKNGIEKGKRKGRGKRNSFVDYGIYIYVCVCKYINKTK